VGGGGRRSNVVDQDVKLGESQEKKKGRGLEQMNKMMIKYVYPGEKLKTRPLKKRPKGNGEFTSLDGERGTKKNNQNLNEQKKNRRTKSRGKGRVKNKDTMKNNGGEHLKNTNLTGVSTGRRRLGGRLPEKPVVVHTILDGV